MIFLEEILSVFFPLNEDSVKIWWVILSIVGLCNTWYVLRQFFFLRFIRGLYRTKANNTNSNSIDAPKELYGIKNSLEKRNHENATNKLVTNTSSGEKIYSTTNTDTIRQHSIIDNLLTLPFAVFTKHYWSSSSCLLTPQYITLLNEHLVGLHPTNISLGNKKREKPIHNTNKHDNGEKAPSRLASIVGGGFSNSGSSLRGTSTTTGSRESGRTEIRRRNQSNALDGNQSNTFDVTSNNDSLDLADDSSRLLTYYTRSVLYCLVYCGVCAFRSFFPRQDVEKYFDYHFIYYNYVMLIL